MKITTRYLLGLIVLVAVLALFTVTISAQTNPPPGVTLSPEQLAKIDATVKNLAAQMPASYQNAVNIGVSVFASLFVILRFGYGLFKNGGGIGAGLLNVFFHAPVDPPAATQPKGASYLKLLLCLLLPALVLTGCTSMVNTPQGKILSVTSRGFGIRITATGSTTDTPEIDCGMFAQTVTLIPTATNGPVSSPNFANSASVDNTVNPFSITGDENTASGNYQTAKGVVVPDALRPFMGGREFFPFVKEVAPKVGC